MERQRTTSTQKPPQLPPRVKREVKKEVKKEERKRRPQRAAPQLPMRPSRQVAPGLSWRARTERPGNKEDWFKSMNPYFASLRDPVNVDDARIPDPTTTPSATFKIIKKGEFNASPTGYAAVTFGGAAATISSVNPPQTFQTMLCPTAVNWMNNAGASFAGYNNYACGALSEDSDVNDIMALNTALYFDGWSDETGIIPGTFTKIRLVSASLTIIPVGTAIQSSGRMIGASLTRCETMRKATQPITTSEIENKPGSTSVYVNQNTALNVLYMPQDPISHQYAPVIDAANGVEGTLTYPVAMTSGAAYIPQGGYSTDEDLWAHSPGELWAVVAGATAGQPFQYVFTGNYEAIPRQTQSMLVPSHVSHSDPIALATAMNRVASAPRVESGTEFITKTIAKPISGPKFSVRPPAKPMIERILDIVGKAGGVAAKVAPLVMAAL